MEEIIKQQLDQYSNTEFSLPTYRQLNLPRYDRHTSFSELSNWTNSDKFASTRLPRISTGLDKLPCKIKNSEHQSLSTHSYCPIKQMDIKLEPLRQDEDSYYCRYLKNKKKSPLRQIQFVTSTERQRKAVYFNRAEVLSTNKLREIIQRKKNSRIDVNLQQYLRATQMVKKYQEKKGLN